MKEEINLWLSGLLKIGVVIIIISTLFLFWNLTTEFYDTPKILILIIVTGLMLLALTVRYVLNNKVVLIRTPLDIPFLLLLAVGIVSTAFSSAPYVSLLGNQLRVHGSSIALVLYILLYFVLVNSLKGGRQIRNLLYTLTFGGVILSVISLLAYAGVKMLPSPWIHGINFTLTGSSFSTTAILALLIPFVVSQLLYSDSGRLTEKEKIIVKGIYSFALTLFGLTIALTGSWVTWIAALAALLLTLLVNRFVETIKWENIKKLNFQATLISLAAPVVLTVFISLLSVIPPFGGAKNPLYEQAKNFPRELQLSFPHSWKIAVSAFRDSPFWGSGPSTFIFDFTNYKPIEVNSTKEWNLRFDAAFNEYLQTLAALGGIGLIALLSLTALFLTSAWPQLRREFRGNDSAALAISGLVFFLILALHHSSLVLWVIGVILLASFMVISSKDQLEGDRTLLPSADHTNLSVKDTILAIAGNLKQSAFSQSFKIEALPSVVVVVSVSLVLFAFYFAGKLFVADYHHRKALNAIAQNQGLLAYNELVISEKLNPYSDLYRTNLAQTNFALANAIASAKGPTEASPSGSLTDQDKQNIQILLQQAIGEGRSATSLSPKSASNWEILALLYRQIAGVAQNALVFSLDSYGKAIFQDPLNPNLRLAVGGVYYAAGNYDLAIRFFTDAINLKSDLANGYFNLSVALRDKGDLNGAQAATERVLSLLENKDSQDYKTVNSYLDDLKNRIASGSAQQSPIQPPASQTTGSLQKKELPNVVDVGTPPEKIATPAAVRRPSPTPSPSP